MLRGKSHRVWFSWPIFAESYLLMRFTAFSAFQRKIGKHICIVVQISNIVQRQTKMLAQYPRTSPYTHLAVRSCSFELSKTMYVLEDLPA